MALKIKNHKTLNDWFSDLTLQQKLDVYFFVNHEPIDFDNLFVGDPPPTDVGTIPFDPTGGTGGMDLHAE